MIVSCRGARVKSGPKLRMTFQPLFKKQGHAHKGLEQNAQVASNQSGIWSFYV